MRIWFGPDNRNRKGWFGFGRPNTQPGKGTFAAPGRQICFVFCPGRNRDEKRHSQCYAFFSSGFAGGKPFAGLGLLTHGIAVEIQRGKNQHNPDHPLLRRVFHARTAIAFRAACHNETLLPIQHWFILCNYAAESACPY